MSYEGYTSYNEDISQTEHYQFQNQDNQTYEEYSNLVSVDALKDITNKIKISEAIKFNYRNSLNSEYEEDRFVKIDNNTKDTKDSRNSKDMTKNSQISQKTKQNQKDKSSDYPLQIKISRIVPKSRTKSLLYFQQNHYHKHTSRSKQKQKQTTTQTQRSAINEQKSRAYKRFRQQNPFQTCQNLKLKQKSHGLSYFAKNQKKYVDQSVQKSIVTSRSGYNMAISDVFLQSMNKMYDKGNRNNELTLKQKISIRLKDGKINNEKINNEKIKNEKIKNDKTKKLKTVGNASKLNLFSHQNKSISNIYKPLDPTEAKEKTILASQPFHDRQTKTLRNKKDKTDKLKQQKIKNQIKQCTFKPRTNLNYKGGKFLK